VTLQTALYAGLALEGEFALRLGEDAGLVASEFAVIELHNYVVRRSLLSAQELIANNAIHAGVVLPLDESRRLSGEIELIEEPISVLRSGQTVGSTTGGALAGGPAASIPRLRAHLDRFGRRLLPRQIVLTGSPL
jgi:2-keto-4-pentenoate hydratase